MLIFEISSFGTSVKYRYDAKGRIARQTVDGSPIDFAYTKYGQLAGKYLGGKEKPDASVEYEYSKSGQIVARTANGVRQTYEYDGRGQLLAVKEGDADVEQYAYDAAGRLVKEGNRTYRYGYLDKVLSVTEGAKTYTYDYHVDGQLARADYGNGAGNGAGNGGRGAGCPQPAGSEDFLWDGLALIKRGDERFVNEPHIGGGNPVASSKGTKYFNDVLGTTLGAKHGKYGKYTPAALTAFGEDISAPGTKHQAPSTFFYTGKPHVAGLGHTFLFRNYRASLGKWQTADPIGYPDGWNSLAYCGNGVEDSLDYLGASKIRDAARAYLDFLKKSRNLIDLENSYTKGEQDRLKRFGGDLRIDLDSYGTFDVVEMGSVIDKGNPYWAGGHLWQPTERVDTTYTYRAHLVFVVGSANEVSSFVAGATSAIPTVWWMGLVETIAGALIPTETRQVIGFEFTLLGTTKQTIFSRRLLE